MSRESIYSNRQPHDEETGVVEPKGVAVKLSRRTFIEASSAAVLGVVVGVPRPVEARGSVGTGSEANPANTARIVKSAPHGMREVADAARVTVARDDYWYYGFTGVAATKGVLVCSYLKTDQHLRTTTDIMIARSEDGGRTWTDHKSIAHLDIDKDGAIWVAPELNLLRDGRLVLICDRGNRKPGQDLPVLSKWQMADRGMSNWIFFSNDAGKTWTTPRKVDDVGGEPERVHELSNGTYVYTRTDSRPTNAIKRPVEPWGANYYRSTAVFSDDKGKTFDRTSILVDDPLVGDCEVGICEYAPGKLIAITRIGDAGSRYGQPSRFVYSSDYGRTWGRPVLAPFYGHRPIPGVPKNSGKLLVSFRNAWGTTGSYVFAFDPRERFAYQPNSFIWDESRCQIKDSVMELRTDDGSRNAVEFTLYPVEDDESGVEMEAEFAVREADSEGCLISAGAWVRFEPNRVSLADREAEGFSFDATKFHRYRIVNRGRKLSIYADGELKLQTSTDGVHTRYVRFGNRPGGRPPVGTIAAEAKPDSTSDGTAANVVASRQTDRRTPLRGVQYRANASHSLWRSVSAKVINRRDHSINWSWNARQGFPDQFRRDRFVRLDRNGTFAAGDSGYSGWTQTEKGEIVIVDYTTGDAGKLPVFVRAYLLREQDLGA